MQMRNISRFRAEEFSKQLSDLKFPLNPVLKDKSALREYDGKNETFSVKSTPDTLLNLCVNKVDKMPLPMVYTWTIEDICKWLKERGYRQYQNTFRANLISGRTLLLLDASALCAMNIKDFEHIKDITRGIRSLFYYEITKFGRSITLYPEFHHELYKQFRLKTGAKYDVRRSDLWRKMQLIRQKEPNYLHWEILERWLNFDKDPEYKTLVHSACKSNLYTCKVTPSHMGRLVNKSVKVCTCLPPCQCFLRKENLRPPWRFKCLSDVKIKRYRPRDVLSVLKLSLPSRYGRI